jgi:nitronate monooxygenase
MLGTHALITQLVAKCAIPIVAAGGIMNGADIKAVIRRGAQAAQLGTAFVCCDESGATPSYKKALLEERSRGTLLTKAFSGRYARGLINAFTHAMAEKTTLPFPLQNTLTATMRQKAAANHDPEYQSLWAGTAYGKARDTSVRVLLQQLRQEMEAA